MKSVYSEAGYAKTVRMMKAELSRLRAQYKVPPVQPKKA